ncbi:MAG: tRNA lysidine(34) synthetase TilS [Flavobacteriales bacterium]
MNLEFTQNTLACLQAEGSLHIAAVSGGLDSMVLCHLLQSLGVQFHVAHVNYGLRGDESDGDEKLVRTFADANNITMHVLKPDTLAEAQSNGQGIQEFAREVRYTWFEKLRAEAGAKFIITAHHKNDQAETIIHQFVRGGSLAALRGMKAVSGNLIRPLLSFSKEEITAYAKHHHVNWRDDSSNQKTEYTRNYIRHEVMPVLQKINPALTTSLADRSALFAELETITNEWLAKECNEHTKSSHEQLQFSIEWIRHHNTPNAVWWHLLSQYNFSASQTQEAMTLCNSNSGKQLHSHTHTLLRDREFFYITSKKETARTSVQIQSAPFHLIEPINIWGDLITKPAALVTEQNTVLLDASLIAWPMELRTWQQGDVFVPLGMKGRQKVSDYLVNNKVPLHEKEKVLVLTSGNEIVWLVDHRAADPFRVTERTRDVLHICTA